MVEVQPTAQCPHCGYPTEIGEHGPECPNNPSNLNKTENVEAQIVPEEKFDEAELFDRLAISEKQESVELGQTDYQDAHPVMEAVDQRSGDNIRESIRMFFEYYSNRGIPDTKTYKEKEIALRDTMRNQRGYPPKSNIPWQIGVEIDEQVRTQLGQPENITIDQAELENLITKELSAVRENAQVTYNVSQDSLEKILKSGRVLSMRELPEEEQKKHRKTGGMIGEIGGADNEGYDDRRAATEQAMGIAKEGESKPVYAALVGGSDVDVEKGGAPQYGGYTLVFDDAAIDGRTMYTEGDSMNPMGMIDPIRKKEEFSERNGVRERQLSRNHAELAQSIYNVNNKIEQQYLHSDPTHRDLSAMVKYIEAQILGGVNMTDVKSIIINNWEFESDIDWYKQEYPEFAEKFKLSEQPA